MNGFYLPIDIKSLYFNIKNDNRTGHSPTVAMPIIQGSSVNPEYAKIVKIPENICESSKQELVSTILSKSNVQAKINSVFCFDKIAVNGVLIFGIPLFCMYIREETGKQNPNYGRQKLHYPSSLVYSDSETEINNKAVFAAVSSELKGYAFIIEGFDYNFDTGVLNFDAIIVGENKIPYSKVFVNKRGVGEKFTKQFYERSDTYDTEILALRERFGYENIYPENYYDVLAQNKQIALEVVADEIMNINGVNCRYFSEQYPYSLYDLSYVYKGKKAYVVVRFTATKQCYFSLPYNKIQFLKDFQDSAQLALVTDINGQPKVRFYFYAEINAMKKNIDSVTFRSEG